jgi:hypothetical protein
MAGKWCQILKRGACGYITVKGTKLPQKAPNPQNLIN